MSALSTTCANGHPVVVAYGQTVCHCGALLNGMRGQLPTVDLREAQT